MKKLYVGNLPFSTTEAELTELFAKHGRVLTARIVTDRETGKSRGFGFVEMEDEGARAAITTLNGYELGGRRLRVNEAHDRGGRPER